MRRPLLAVAVSLLSAALLAASPAQAVRNPVDYSESGGCGGLAPYVVYCASQPWTAWTGSFGIAVEGHCPAAGACVGLLAGGISLSVSGPSYYLEYDCSFECELVTQWGSVAAGDDLFISGWVYAHDACYEVSVDPLGPVVTVCPPMETGPEGFWGVYLY